MAPPHEFFLCKPNSSTTHTQEFPCKPNSILPPHADVYRPIEDLKHISLRPFKLSDVEDYMLWASDERVHEFFTSTPPITSKEEALEELEEYVIPHPWYRAICLRGRPIGFVSLDQGQGENKWYIGEISYGLSYKYWGRGITTVAVKKAIYSIFQELQHLERVVALVVKENASSRKVIEKVGFNQECVLSKHWEVQGKKRDVVLYGLFRFDLEENSNDDDDDDNGLIGSNTTHVFSKLKL